MRMENRDHSIEESVQETDRACLSCGHRMKERSEKERRDMLNRLSRIEG